MPLNRHHSAFLIDPPKYDHNKHVYRRKHVVCVGREREEIHKHMRAILGTISTPKTYALALCAGIQ